jgi:hypothetical protein
MTIERAKVDQFITLLLNEQTDLNQLLNATQMAQIKHKC